MPKRPGTRTAPSKKRRKPLVRFMTKAHREERTLDGDAAERLLKTLKHATPGKGKVTPG